MSVIPQVRICAGGTRRRVSLPRPRLLCNIISHFFVATPILTNCESAGINRHGGGGESPPHSKE